MMMDKHAKISIIMPVYNMAQYLEQSIASWVGQTLSEIEIICVDDASTDSSRAILNAWAEKDSRIIIHTFSENRSAFCARKKGMELASGEYILFADADDMMLLNACEELYLEMQRDPVDILHFDANIINVNELPEARIEYMRRFVKPYSGKLAGPDVLTGCFREHKYRFSLWNKLFSARICKEAVKCMPDVCLPKAQDKLTYLILAYFARNYRGLPGKKYYQYFFGRGGTGFNHLNMSQFERYCTMAGVADQIHQFLEKQGLLERYQDIADTTRKELLNECVAKWLDEVSEEEKPFAFDTMLKYWNSVELIGILAEKKYYERHEIAGYVADSTALSYDKRKVKTIATYYHSCVNGGVQRVLCQLCEIWVNLGYRVIVLTDTPPTGDDYALPDGVERIVIQDYQQTNRFNYIGRCAMLHQIIEEKHVDAVVYHAWVLNLMLWDEMTIKSAGAAFIAHCHNVFSVGLLRGWQNYRNVIAPYLIADAVISLSAADTKFWEYYNNNVFEVINPFTDGLEQWTPATLDGEPNILWLARLSEEKRPGDTLYIMRHVLMRVPNAMLHIVGGSKSEEYEERFKAKIREMNLQDHVILHGFHKDVKPFYQNASVFLITSEYEGFLLTLQESMLSGLPCVTYEMPYLTLCENNRGIISVRQKDVKAAANAIVELLQDDEKRKRYGQNARQRIEELFQYDFLDTWSRIFSSLSQEHEAKVTREERTMMETLILHHDEGLKKVNKGNSNKPKSNEREYGRGVRDAQLTKTYLAGRVVTWIPKQIRSAVRSVKHDGMKTTASKAFYKLAKLPKEIRKFTSLWMKK